MACGLRCIYIKSLSFFEEAHLGYIIDWNNSDAEDTIDNEIDVLVLKKMNVGFVETDAFKTHTPSQIFNTALQGTE